MQLETAEVNIDDPSVSRIRETLHQLDGEDNHFAILSIDDMTYLQTSGSPETGFVLEYQDGSLDRHFTADGEPLSLEDVTAAFADYLTRNDRWRSRFTWKREEPGAGSGCGSASAALLVGLCVGIQFVKMMV